MWKAEKALEREIGHRQGATSTLSNLGHLHVLMGKHETAWGYLREALSESMAIGVIPLTLDALIGVALLRAKTKQEEAAAELVGLVVNHPAVEADTMQVAEGILAELRGTLTEERVKAAMERGKAMDLESVVEGLLSED